MLIENQFFNIDFSLRILNNKNANAKRSKPVAEKASAHQHAHPVWVLQADKNTQCKATVLLTKPWRPLQNLLEPLSRLSKLEIVLIERHGVCVAGTGPYKKATGLKIPSDTALALSLSSGGGCGMIHNPREDRVCHRCSVRGECRDQANYFGPISIGGQVIAAAQIVAFDLNQKSLLMEKAKLTFGVVRQLVSLLYRSEILPNARTEHLIDDCFHKLIGHTQPMRHLFQQIRRAGASNGNVLITGETGTGKELVARAIHEESGRSGPFIPINCGAMPEHLVESELFGYAKGAFSGAASNGRAGLWEMAHQGSLFLDEVEEMPLFLQVKLLRALQDGCVRRVGDSKIHRFDTRILAASNQPLAEKVSEGTLREDLYYRLNVIPVRVPALRERPGDISALAHSFLKQCRNSRAGRPIGIEPDLLHHLTAYSWPGNVRELQNCIEYGVHACECSMISWDIMSDFFEHSANIVQRFDPRKITKKTKTRMRKTLSPSPDEIHHALGRYGSNLEGKRQAAKSLHISLATLYRRLKRE